MVQSLPGFLDLCLNVCSPSQVLGDVYTEVLEAAHPLHRGPTDHKRCVGPLLSLPEVYNQLFRIRGREGGLGPCNGRGPRNRGRVGGQGRAGRAGSLTVGSRTGEDSVDSRTGAGSGADSVGSRTGVDSVGSRTGVDSEGSLT